MLEIVSGPSILMRTPLSADSALSAPLLPKVMGFTTRGSGATVPDLVMERGSHGGCAEGVQT